MSDANNQLKVGERYRLCRWWESVASQHNGKSSSLIAADAQKALGFPVTASNILTAYKVTGLKPTGVAGRKPGGGPSSDRTRFLARQILEIRRALDMDIDPYLIAIANGIRKDSVGSDD